MFITPTWHAPANVGAIQTTRHGGVSAAPFDSLNLGFHVADNPSHVAQNRALLNAQLPNPAIFVEQVHGNKVLHVDENFNHHATYQADGLYTQLPLMPLAMMTADCLPILLTNTTGEEVAALHGGWRGLAAGIITTGVKCFASPASTLVAWLGPAIGKHVFEVGSEVKQAFCQLDAAFGSAFAPALTLQQANKQVKEQKYLADIQQLGSILLQQAGVTRISALKHCTYSQLESHTHGQSQRYFSYRREGQTGRMASVIWRK